MSIDLTNLHALVYHGSKFYDTTVSVHATRAEAIEALIREVGDQLDRKHQPREYIDRELERLRGIGYELAYEEIVPAWGIFDEDETPEIVETDLLVAG